MKTSAKLFATAALALSTVGLQAQLHGDPLYPIGSLDVLQKMVRSGKKSTMDWEISYPVSIPDLLMISPTKSLNPKTDLRLEVRAIGAHYADRSHDNGHGNNEDGVDGSNPSNGGGGANGEEDTSVFDDELILNGNYTITEIDLKTALWIRTSPSQPWLPVFTRFASTLNGAVVYQDSYIPQNAIIDFAAAGKSDNGEWTPKTTTGTNTPRVVVLQNGDLLPTNSAFQSSQIAGHLSNYTKNGRLTLGPRQLIYLFDFDTSDVRAKDYVVKDLAIIVTLDDLLDN